MFNLLVSSNGTSWETDQIMRSLVERFKECSAHEAKNIDIGSPESLASLERVPSILMYENGVRTPNGDVVRYGFLRGISVTGKDLTFGFTEHGRIPRPVIIEFSQRLGISEYELNRTHWAIKDGGIPAGVTAAVVPTPKRYDLVFSFAGENRLYVAEVEAYLRGKSVSVFYDQNEEASLWGKDLAEHFDDIYRKRARYCVMFISQYYAEKMWTNHERKTALSRALVDRSEYILPARFDDTDVPGIRPTVAHIDLRKKTPAQLGELLLQKLAAPLG